MESTAFRLTLSLTFWIRKVDGLCTAGLRHSSCDVNRHAVPNSPDFPLVLPDFSRGKNPVPPQKNQVKITRFPPSYSAPKQHSILFLQTFFLSTRTSPPGQPTPTPPVPHPACPHPASHHLASPHTARSGLLRHLRQNITLITEFSGVVQDFSRVLPEFFHRAGTGFFPRAVTHLLRSCHLAATLTQNDEP